MKFRKYRRDSAQHNANDYFYRNNIYYHDENQAIKT